MKKCPFCGKENKDAAKFCTGCGKTLEDAVIEPDPPEWNEPAPAPAPAPSQTPAFAPAPAPAAPKAAQPAGVRRTPAQAKLKELAGSKLALVICIAFTVMLLFSICTSAMLPAQMADEVGKAFDSLDVADLEDLIEDAGLDIDVQEVYDAIRDFTEESLNRPVNMVRSLFSAASSNIVSILIAVALWIIYGVAKDENSVCCGTTGLKIIRVLRILGLILGIIVMVVALLALIFCIYMFAREGVEEGRVVMIVLTVIFAVIFLLILLFLCGVLSTLKKLISVSENSPARGKISGYVGFWLYVGGVFSALGALGSIALIFTAGPGAVPAVLSCVASAVFSFALGRFLFRSKKELKAL